MNQTLSQEPIRLIKRLLILYVILYPICLVLTSLLGISVVSSRDVLSMFFLMAQVMEQSNVFLMPLLFAVHVFCFYGKRKTKIFLIGAYVAWIGVSLFSIKENVDTMIQNRTFYVLWPELWQAWTKLVLSTVGLVVLFLLLIACFTGQKGIQRAKKLVLIKAGVAVLPFLIELVALCWMVMTNTLRLMFPEQVSLAVGLGFMVLSLVCNACSLLPLAGHIVYWHRAAEKETELLPHRDEKTVAL